MLAVESYNEVEYQSMPVGETDPLLMALVAALHGHDAPDPRTADVLELGCGDGGNLMSLACSHPGIRGVGFDPAVGAIERGREVLGRIGLENVTLEHDASAVSEPGTADYVIGHGVLSWVPREVASEVVAEAARAVRPGGLVSFSYRVFPYAFYELPARELAQRAIRDAEAEAAARGETLTWLDQLRIARERVALAASIPSTPPHSHVMQLMSEKWSHTLDWSLFHDDLSDPMFPYRSEEVAELAAANGLKYVGELIGHDLWQHRFDDGFIAKVRELAGDDAVRARQLVDDLQGMNFHSALFVKADEAPETEPAFRGRDLWVRQFLPGLEKGDLHSDQFSAGVAQVIREHHPEAVLASEIAEELGRDPLEIERDLLRLYAFGLVRLSTVPPPVPVPVGEHPRLTPLALDQINSGQVFAASRFLFPVGLELSAKRVAMGLIDGTRTAKAIRRDLPAAAAAAGLTVYLDETLANIDGILAEASMMGLLAASGD